MKYFEIVVRALNRFVEGCASALLVAMVVIVFLQVLFRFVIRSSLPWSEEAARYILVWLSFLGASIAVRRHGHVGVEALVKLLGATPRRMVSMVALFMALLFFGFLAVYGFKILGMVFYQSSPAMEISMAIPYSALFGGAILMTIYTTFDLLSVLFDRGGDTL
ncbi:MAG: C4-dicarboxylate ABC transporter substrate-binding protein [Dethiosulfovibrio peptidovorans]|nr:MAG: C4-dicarboxylate ABC transporter substrate-binding protein [Dethiosulfovibrio peptidovorans]